MKGNAGTELERLVEIMARLRAEGGCPWDREQDLRSLRPFLLEEAYEVLEEMDQVAYGGDWRPLCEELGDLLFQIVFHAQLAHELGAFELADVCAAISDKIVRRHPHVFGAAAPAAQQPGSSEAPARVRPGRSEIPGTRGPGADQILADWAILKAEERRQKTGYVGSVLDGVPNAAP